MPAFDEVVEAVRARVEPDPAERDRLRSAVDEVVGRTERALDDLDIDAEVRHVGSTARGTWLASEGDIDVFVRFPVDLAEDDLERLGLEVGHAVLPDGREEFADHPYVSGVVNDVDVDLVPCYAVEAATGIVSAVDRTPFHTDYILEHLSTDEAGDVRLLKAFLSGFDAYGSDLRTRGFSGYLTELLVMEFGGFRPLLEAAADWAPPLRIDPEDHGGGASFDDPLVVIDPTDPDRNVAAVLTARNLARFQHYSRQLLAQPTLEVFYPPPPEPVDAAAVRARVEARSTTPVAVVFAAPDLHEDELYPQLRKSLAGIGGELERRGFADLRRAVMAADRAVLFLELEAGERPAIERHEGPPVAVRDHAEAFLEAYADADVAGPFVEDDRYVVERDREFATVRGFLESDALFDVRLGPAVESALREGYDVLVGGAVASLADEFGTELAAYFDPRP